MSTPTPHLDWLRQARCAGHEFPALWDADVHGESQAQRQHRKDTALQVCDRCPVADACRAATEMPADRGAVRGGVIVGRVAPMGRPRSPISHGTPGGARTHIKRGEDPCEACLEARREQSRQRWANRQRPVTA